MDREQRVRDLVNSELGWLKLKELMSSHKDADRFEQYVKILQEKVQWKERILLPYGLHLYIVEQSDHSRIVKCDCGYEFGDYRRNWKLSSLIYVRNTEKSIEEVYPPLMGFDPDWMELREYYCPGCKTLLEIEAVPPGYPVVFDFQPDLDAFYKDWLGKPLPH